MIHFLEYLKISLAKKFKIPVGRKMKLAGYTVFSGNIGQLSTLFREIFLEKNYECEMPGEPYIIDGGANIGLAVLYFKKRYPKARVVAFEPNPESFALLKKNVEYNQLDNVELHQAALTRQEGHIVFYTSATRPEADYSASVILDQVPAKDRQGGAIREVKVPAKLLSPFIDRHVDLLKLDIEGAEGGVFEEIRGKFDAVTQCIMEYHGRFDNGENALAPILQVLEDHDHGFVLTPLSKSTNIKRKRGYLVRSRRIE